MATDPRVDNTQSTSWFDNLVNIFNQTNSPLGREPEKKTYENLQGVFGKGDQSVVGGAGGKTVADFPTVNSRGSSVLDNYAYNQRVGNPKYSTAFGSPTTNARRASGGQGGTGGGEFDLLNIGDALRQAQEIMSSMGVGGSVSFDPLRNQARSQWADADARTLAMAQQLQKSIGDQAAGLGQTYDQGVDATNQATEFANNQNLQTAQGANDMLSQQAQALGTQEAVGNQIAAGNFAGRDMTDRTADTTARGQITSNALIGNRASALDFNNDLVGAAGLSGQQARLARQNELNRLLAGYDTQEQEANAKSQSDFTSQSLSYAMDLLGLNRDDFKQWNENQRYAQSEANDSWYDQARIAKGAAGATGMNQKEALDRALDYYGWGNEAERHLGSLEDRQKIMALVDKYMGLD